MAVAISLRDDFDGPALRKLGKLIKDAAQARRLLALAAICDGGSRTYAARMGMSVDRVLTLDPLASIIPLTPPLSVGLRFDCR